jgi:serine/threonine-protein phosphatase PGAM5
MRDRCRGAREAGSGWAVPGTQRSAPRPRPLVRASRVALAALTAALATLAVAFAKPAPAPAPSAAAPARGGESPRSAGIRTLILVRHGAYDEDDPRDAEVGKALTAEGEAQVRLTAERLAKLTVRPDLLYASTLTRARQSGEIIGAALGLEPVISPDLSECTPPTTRADVMARQKPGDADSCRAQIERVWALHFRPTRGADTTEVIVAHGNVIRYLVSRALGLDPSLWLNMTIANCSLSVVQVRADGRVRLVSFDDVGHLPPAMQAYPQPLYDPGPKPRRR